MESIIIVALCTLAAFAIFAIADEIRIAKSNAARWKNNYSNLHKKTQTKETKTMTPTMQTELDNLIAETKGKFFSITFVKKDGTTRVINGKDKYQRLLKGGVDTVRDAGYVPFVNRNTETWASAHKDAVVTFRCGKLIKEVSA